MRFVFSSATVLLALAASAYGSASYTLTDLGVLPGESSSSATSINNLGQVVGNSWTSGDYGRGFLYTSEEMMEIGLRTVTDINDSGQIVGTAVTGQHETAALYCNGITVSIGTLPGCSGSIARAVNSSGQVAGTAYDWSQPSYFSRAFLYSAGTFTDLGTLPGGTWSESTSINDNGTIVGYADTASGYTHALIWSDGTVTDLGTFPNGVWSQATGINAHGQIIGQGTRGDYYHAFVYNNGELTDIGLLSDGFASDAYGINATGQVVGGCCVTNGEIADEHAFLYSDGVMVDLNETISTSTEWTLNCATAINDAGQIVAEARNSVGQRHALLLTPIPEPSEAVLVCSALLILCCKRSSLAKYLLPTNPFVADTDSTQHTKVSGVLEEGASRFAAR